MSNAGVEDEAARSAEREHEVAARERARLVRVVEQQAAVDRDRELLVEDPEIRARTGRASVRVIGSVLVTIVGLGNGHDELAAAPRRTRPAAP